jgi:hypothetical protein
MAPVYEANGYRPDHIRLGMRFAETVRRDDTGQAIADLSRISVLEPDTCCSRTVESSPNRNRQPAS